MLISVIGCGKVGRSLCQLWQEKGVFDVLEVVNQTIESTDLVISMMGLGSAVSSISLLREVDVMMISTSDAAIKGCATVLANNQDFKEGTIVFHCSGALSSMELDCLRDRGAFVCSAHPVKSFAGKDESIETFLGTNVALEGDEEAVSVLSKAFESIGGIPFLISTDSKILYHVALSIVSNFLPPLMESGLSILREIGMTSEQAYGLIEPLVRGTVDNIFKLGPAHALTGPISRGDYGVVNSHIEALMNCDMSKSSNIVEMYNLLAKVTEQLVKK